MKTQFRIFCLLLALLPTAATAQEKVIKAFDAIINCKRATILETHSLDRNPETGAKTGQSDIYRFTLPMYKKDLVKDVMKAFREDTDRAYSLSTGQVIDDEVRVILAVGDAEKDNVVLSEPGCEYAYSCFLAPKSEDPTGRFRYAYGISYKEEDGRIIGKLVVTYATTMKHRQDAFSSNNFNMNGAMPNDVRQMLEDFGETSWFRQFMLYVQAMSTASASARISFASKIYELCQDVGKYRRVTDLDKRTAREVMDEMLNDNRYTNEVKRLIKVSIEALQ